MRRLWSCALALLPCCAPLASRDAERPERHELALDMPCPARPAVVGQIEDPELDEISGLVESWHQPGVFFVHNDSGDSPRFFAIDRRGRVLAELELPDVPLLLDAEDIALGPGPGGAPFVYLGDTGNNFASMGLGIPRLKAVLYRVPEPHISNAAQHVKLELRDAFPIVLTFPNGARDVEAFFVDPWSGDLVMISKQPNGRSQILSASAALLAAGGGELRLAGELVFGRGALGGSPMPTAASITRDGSAILVRTYSSVFLFRRRAGEPAPAALLRAPEPLPAPAERGGEAIGFTERGAAFVTVPEGVRPAVSCSTLPVSRD
jgi:hypothetical protein